MIPIIEYKDQIESVIILHDLDFKYSYEPDIGALPLEIRSKEILVEPSLLDSFSKRICHLHSLGPNQRYAPGGARVLVDIYYKDPIVVTVSLCHLAVDGPCKHCTIETLPELKSYEDRVYES